MSNPTSGESTRTLEKIIMSDRPRFNALINGKSVESASKQTFETINPYTSQPWADVARCNAEDANLAVEAAHQAFTTGDWATMTATRRGALLHRL